MWRYTCWSKHFKWCCCPFIPLASFSYSSLPLISRISLQWKSDFTRQVAYLEGDNSVVFIMSVYLKSGLTISVISKLNILPLMCTADKVCITELTLIHKNIRSVCNSHAQELTLILKLSVSVTSNTFDVIDKNNNVSFEDLNIHYQ